MEKNSVRLETPVFYVVYLRNSWRNDLISVEEHDLRIWLNALYLDIIYNNYQCTALHALISSR